MADDDHLVPLWGEIAATIMKYDTLDKMEVAFVLARAVGVVLSTLPDGTNMEGIEERIISQVSYGNQLAHDHAHPLAKMAAAGRA